jgi:SAM-dependent methyltransferase/uncharacterized coiled-coil protein SlyX
MIETTIADINVSELMERVRAKAEEIRRAQARPKLPSIAAARPLSRAVLPQPVAPKTERILGAIQTARRATSVSRWIPKPFRALFRRQDRFNRETLRVVEFLASTNAQLADRLRHLSACVEVQDQGLQDLAELGGSDREWMHAVAQIILTADEKFADVRVELQMDLESRMQRYAEEVNRCRDVSAGFRGEMDRAGEHLRNLQHQLDQLAPLVAEHRGEMDRTGKHLRNLQHQLDQLAPLAAESRRELDRAGEHLGNLQGQVDRLELGSAPTRSQIDVLTGELRVTRDELGRAGEHLRNLQSQVDGAVAAYKEPLRLEQTVARLEQRLTDDGSYIKGELAHYRSLMAQLSVRAGAKGKKSSKATTPPTSTTLDSFYVSFEDRFRGPRSEIKARLEFYLPVIAESGAGSTDRPVLDVGCGRGEWLELLKEQELVARGVDMNSSMRAHCAERGLDVVHADAIDHLRTLPSGSYGAVTGFHIIEHLSLDVLLELFSQAHRVLQPGGVAIFESPNCKNLVVGASTFNIDPTHRNPVFPDCAQFVLALNGFEPVDICYLNPVEALRFNGRSRVSTVLNELLYGPQDFSVIAHKPLRG